MFKGLLFFIQFSWINRKSYLFLNALNQLIVGFFPLIIIALPKYIIDELLANHRPQVLASYVVILIIANFLNNWLTQKINLLIFNDRCALSAEFGAQMHQKLVNADFENLESPSFFDMKEKANKFLYGDWHGFCYVLESAFSIISRTITAFGIVAIIATLNYWMILACLFMVAVSSIIDYKSKVKAHGLSLDAVGVERRWNYFTRILEDPEYSKEIRINQIGSRLIDNEKIYAYSAMDFYKKKNSFFSKSIFLNEIFNLIQSAIMYIYLIFQFLNNRISVGDFTMYISAVAAFSSMVKGLISSALDIKVYGVYYDALKNYLEIEETMRNNKKIGVSSDKEFIIEFRNVYFRYPGQKSYALENVNLIIHSGKILSIVGENGSGKTTIVKLLCRLYDPTEGEILYNGVNIKDLDYDQYLGMFAAVFQDFKLFSFSVLENIVWDKRFPEIEQYAFDVLDKVGLKNRIELLPNGIETMVYKEFEKDGFEPSGGEAQRIAIARALVKNPEILLLDEPLSSLDPRAEYEMFAQLDSLIKGKTVVYISHRLSTCQLSDEIAVFHDGKLVEIGTHDELINCNGKYKELYLYQAQYYK